MKRRHFLLGSSAAMALMSSGLSSFHHAHAASDPLLTLTDHGANLMPEKIIAVEKTMAQWKETLTPEQFAVLRKEATERPFSSPLNNEKRKGTFHCAGCDLPLYRSETKFDSGTGWPSFWEAIQGSVATKTDYGLFLPRTEVHCIRCHGHQGHIFNDGPKPTYNRHCINGIALNFKPDAA